MLEPMQKATDDFQKMSKDNYDAVLRSYGELNKGLQAIAARVTDYSKTAFEDATRAFEQMVGAKSLESVIEIQSQYAKKAYDTWVAEASKLGEMYAAIARDAYNQGTKKVRPREGRSLLDPCKLPERGVRRRWRLREHPILSRVESCCDSLALGEINEHLRFVARTHHFWRFLRCLLGLVCRCSGQRRCAHPVELRWHGGGLSTDFRADTTIRRAGHHRRAVSLCLYACVEHGS